MIKYIFILLFCASAAYADVDFSLYLVTSQNNKGTEWLKQTVHEAVIGGVTIVQLQQEEMTTDEMIEFGIELHQILEMYDVPLIINEDVDVAVEIGANGVHFLNLDPDVIADARERLGPDGIIGVSLYDLDEISPEFDVDYISFGPIFASSSFPGQEPWGIEGVEAAVQLSNKPVVCVGGIRQRNAAEVFQAGADGIVVVSAILSAKDPQQAAENLIYCK